MLFRLFHTVHPTCEWKMATLHRFRQYADLRVFVDLAYLVEFVSKHHLAALTVYYHIGVHDEYWTEYNLRLSSEETCSNLTVCKFEQRNFAHTSSESIIRCADHDFLQPPNRSCDWNVLRMFSNRSWNALRMFSNWANSCSSAAKIVSALYSHVVAKQQQTVELAPAPTFSTTHATTSTIPTSRLTVQTWTTKPTRNQTVCPRHTSQFSTWYQSLWHQATVWPLFSSSNHFNSLEPKVSSSRTTHWLRTVIWIGLPWLVQLEPSSISQWQIHFTCVCPQHQRVHLFPPFVHETSGWAFGLRWHRSSILSAARYCDHWSRS